jgi:hypothetical protein
LPFERFDGEFRAVAVGQQVFDGADLVLAADDGDALARLIVSLRLPRSRLSTSLSSSMASGWGVRVRFSRRSGAV